jgi:quinone-modifying oxidoreductase subunit QmoC
MEIKRTIKYEADKVPGFGDEVRRVPGCERLYSCIQCGTCSGVCPLSIYMDYSPRQIMALVRSDFKNEALRSHTIWLCASCYACTVECPRQIRITDIMYELKQRAMQDGIYPRKFAIPVLAKEFYKMAHQRGRVTENVLAALMFFKTNWMEMLKMWKLGLGLVLRGRFSFKLESIRRRDELKRMMKTVDDLNIGGLHDEGTKPRPAAGGEHA